MRLKLWLMVVFMVVLMGCGGSESSKTVEGRNGEEAFFASMQSMGEDMSLDEIDRMEENMNIIVQHLLGDSNEDEIDILMERLDGMTAQDIVKLADALRK